MLFCVIFCIAAGFLSGPQSFIILYIPRDTITTLLWLSTYSVSCVWPVVCTAGSTRAGPSLLYRLLVSKKIHEMSTMSETMQEVYL